MFNSIVNAPPMWSTGKLKSGVGLSILAHAAVLVIAVLIQNAAITHEAPKEPVLVFKAARPPKGNPAPVATTAQPAAEKPKLPKRDAPPRVVKPLPVDPPPVVASIDPTTTAPDLGLPFIEGSDPNGVEHDGVPHASPGVGPGGSGIDSVPFGQGMTLPALLGGKDIVYTREAREARVTGMLIARCTITRKGEVRDCRVIKGLPLMTDTVVAALLTRKYTPVTFQGQPVSVTYVFNVKLTMP